MECAQARRHQTPCMAQDPSPVPGRRMAHSPRGGIDEETLEVRAVEVTSSDVGDAPTLPELLSQIPREQEIGSVTADVAYDTRKCHDAIAELGAHAVIPPRKNAKPWKTVTAGAVQVPSRATRLCERRNIWAARSGDPSRQHPLDAPAGQWMERLPPSKPRRNLRRARKQSGGLFSRRTPAHACAGWGTE